MKKSQIMKSHGFTLVEMMIVVVIVGLLASFAIPAFRQANTKSINSRLMNDYRIHAEAFKRFALETGAYPPDGGFGSMPVGMNEYLPATWLDSPVGGQWIWDNNDWGVTAAISIRNGNVTSQQMTQLDSQLDDGDLATGMFRKINADRFSLVIEE